MNFTQPHLTIEEQIALFKSRGLEIDDEEKAHHVLSNISYFRLNPFIATYQKPDKSFIEKITFNNILDCYFLDRELRVLIFDAIERIEIAFRTQLSYHLSIDEPSMYDLRNRFNRKWWYEKKENFRKEDQFYKDISKIDRIIDCILKRDRELLENARIRFNGDLQKVAQLERNNTSIVWEFRKNYSHPRRMPSWMLFEVATLGMVSKLFENLNRNELKRNICKFFKVPQQQVLESWLHAFNQTRNVCAHHLPLTYRNMPIKPKYIKGAHLLKEPWLNDQIKYNNASLFYFTSCCLYLLKAVNPETHFVQKMKDILNKYQNTNLERLGFLDNWDKEPLWTN